MNITAIIGLRWLPVAAIYGASALALWMVAVVCFFLPLSFVALELTCAMPEEGGMAVWIKKAFGEKYAFLTSWFYWVNSFVYGPSLLTFVAIAIAFIFDPALATNKYYIAAIVLGGFWGVALLNLRGMKEVKWLPDLAGPLGTVLPGIIIIAVGVGAVLFGHHPIATSYAWHNWIPHLGSESNLAFLTALMFAMAGIELAPTLAGETENPSKTFIRATWISAIFIIGLYTIGTVAINFILAPDQVAASSGILDALQRISKETNMPIILISVALMLAFGNIGCVSVWVAAPIKMLLESTKQGILPKKLTHLDKNAAPVNAIILQATLITVITLAALFFAPSVNAFYEVMILLSTIICFIPYLFLFFAFISLRKHCPEMPRPYRLPGGMFGVRLASYAGIISVGASILLAFSMPPNDVVGLKNIITYHLEIGLPPIAFWLIGIALYARYQHKDGIFKRMAMYMAKRIQQKK